jgi:predicted TIM-barrel fold metal-dependent hydrolase
MISQGVRAARIFHGSYHFPISDWCIGEVLDELAAHRVPTFLDPNPEFDTVASDKFDFDAIDVLCRSHPTLPVVLSEARFHSSNRLLYQLFAKYPNLHVELSGLWANHGIEFITEEFGASRLLFGTRMPIRDPGCAVAQVVYSDISDENKRLIAGESLRRMLAGVVA